MSIKTTLLGRTRNLPSCASVLYDYGIGNCCGCQRFPVVLYRIEVSATRLDDRWRCEACYTAEAGKAPGNKVSL